MGPRENKTKYAILGVLSFSSKSGYEVSKSLKSSTAYFWAESDGQIYPILKRLCDEGLVVYEEENTEGRRRKKIYSLTDDGQSELNDWLVREPTTFNVRNEFLLQLFFGHNIADKYNIEKIKFYKMALIKQLKEYEAIEIRIKNKSKYPTYLLLSLSYGQHSIKAEIDWCDEAIKILGKTDD